MQSQRWDEDTTSCRREVLSALATTQLRGHTGHLHTARQKTWGQLSLFKAELGLVITST